MQQLPQPLAAEQLLQLELGGEPQHELELELGLVPELELGLAVEQLQLAAVPRLGLEHEPGLEPESELEHPTSFMNTSACRSFALCLRSLWDRAVL